MAILRNNTPLATVLLATMISRINCWVPFWVRCHCNMGCLLRRGTAFRGRICCFQWRKLQQSAAEYMCRLVVNEWGVLFTHIRHYGHHYMVIIRHIVIYHSHGHHSHSLTNHFWPFTIVSHDLAWIRYIDGDTHGCPKKGSCVTGDGEDVPQNPWCGF